MGILLLISLIMIGSYLLNKDNNYYKDMKKDILNHTEIKKINYINRYGNYYITIDDSYLYVLSLDYKEITKIDLVLLYENKNNYDIIYEEDKVMYYKDYLKNGKLVCEYYDIYKYELIKTVTLGE